MKKKASKIEEPIPPMVQCGRHRRGDCSGIGCTHSNPHFLNHKECSGGRRLSDDNVGRVCPLCEPCLADHQVKLINTILNDELSKSPVRKAAERMLAAGFTPEEFFSYRHSSQAKMEPDFWVNNVYSDMKDLVICKKNGGYLADR